MPVSPSTGRHRAVGRPTTALTDFAETASGSLAQVGRRTAVVAAGSGLIMSALAAPAVAAPAVSAPVTQSTARVPSIDTSGLTASARAAIETAPAVTVAKDATWTFDVPVLKVVADPRAKPRVAPVASRSVERAPAPASAGRSGIMEIAKRYLGVPYVWGASSPSGMDCSGFTTYVYAQLGITLPHSSAAQRYSGRVVSRADALPGDLITTPGHVAMYAGGDMLIDATPGNVIRFHAIYQSNPVFIRVG
ncbi:C40 family peptidase [Pengzhenrongella sp.]|uniref:C40 family peptidase n=1 Tax=Pengzhenrongella sp. TaxID=2888820 RepID=UPI002F92B87C